MGIPASFAILKAPFLKGSIFSSEFRVPSGNIQTFRYKIGINK